MNEQVHQFLIDLFSASALNCLPARFRSGRIFAEPLIGVSQGDDYIFQKFKEVVAPEHLAPAEMWTKSGLPNQDDLAARLRIVSIVFPYVKKIREESKNVEKMANRMRLGIILGAMISPVSLDLSLILPLLQYI